MMKRISIALWAAVAAFFIACAPASAQWQTPLNTLPLGRGAGTGFSFVPQGTNGQALFGNTGSAPAFRAPAFTDLTGQATLSQLPTIGTNTVLANVTGGSGTPTAATVTSILDTICATQGAVLVRNSGAWACVTGTNGQVLTSGGPAADTTFTTIPGTGTVTTITAGTDITMSSGANCTTTCTINVGSGVTRTIASGAKALATTAISSGSCTTAQTDTATGTLTTDSIIVTFNGDPTAVTGYAPATSGGLTIYPYPTANTVNFKVCNSTASSVTPGAVTLNWRVVR